MRRATTTALNARLIPLLTDLIDTVRQMLARAGVRAPLMVVKGDGSLVRAEWAMQRPIETILSGPAASVVGASHLAQMQDVWVIDMGGTTTDIAGLVQGLPGINDEGAQVGGWRTMVEAIDVYTEGLGGDSMIQPARDSSDPAAVRIGPRRALPLSVLAARHPETLTVLRAHAARSHSFRNPGQFALALRSDAPGLTSTDRALLGLLADGPLSVDELTYATELGKLAIFRLERLAAQFVVQLSAFTPTDALHALGYFHRWDDEAARLGAKILAEGSDLSPDDFCKRVVEEVAGQVSKAVISKALTDENIEPAWDEPTTRALLRKMLRGENGAAFRCEVHLDRPIVAIGAPVAAYLPRTAALLHADLLIPEHADVANAVGAVAASVVQRRAIAIQPLEVAGDEFYQVHLPAGVREFDRLEDAVAATREAMEPFMIELAQRAGAGQVEVKCDREDVIAPLEGGWNAEIWLGTTLTFTAVGRPALAGVG